MHGRANVQKSVDTIYPWCPQVHVECSQSLCAAAWFLPPPLPSAHSPAVSEGLPRGAVCCSYAALPAFLTKQYGIW